MRAHTHTCTQTRFTHTSSQSYTHPHTLPQTQTHIHTPICSRTHSRSHMCAQKHLHLHLHVHLHIRSLLFACTYTHTHHEFIHKKCTHTHAHTHHAEGSFLTGHQLTYNRSTTPHTAPHGSSSAQTPKVDQLPEPPFSAFLACACLLRCLY